MAKKRDVIDLSPESDVGAAVAEIIAADEPQPVPTPDVQVGEIVHYFRNADSGSRNPIPAVVMGRPLTGGGVNLLLLQMAAMQSPRHNVPYSPEPAPGCWTLRR